MKIPNSCKSRATGFSLVEVMVALVVCAIGLLGLAKMESLALSSTGVASSRSLAALQASSMAAAMHANRAWWGSGSAAASTTVDGTPTNNFSTAVACTTPGSNACNPQQMAYYDMQQWAIALSALLPGFSSTITCSTSGLPVNCTIQVKWMENAVAAESQQSNIANLAAPTYTVYVEP